MCDTGSRCVAYEVTDKVQCEIRKAHGGDGGVGKIRLRIVPRGSCKTGGKCSAPFFLTARKKPGSNRHFGRGGSSRRQNHSQHRNDRRTRDGNRQTALTDRNNPTFTAWSVSEIFTLLIRDVGKFKSIGTVGNSWALIL